MKNNRSGDSSYVETQRMGKVMGIMACLIIIALLSYFFSELEEQKKYPNQSPSSEHTHKHIKVRLKRNQYGHYLTHGEIDNKAVIFLLDTGATSVAIPSELEDYLHLKRGQAHKVSTANGKSIAYETKINQIRIGDIVLHHVKASIIPNMKGQEILLGMSALKQIEFRQKGLFITLIQEL
jgi:aspartyl protease family protein